MCNLKIAFFSLVILLSSDTHLVPFSSLFVWVLFCYWNQHWHILIWLWMEFYYIIGYNLFQLSLKSSMPISPTFTFWTLNRGARQIYLSIFFCKARLVLKKNKKKKERGVHNIVLEGACCILLAFFFLAIKEQSCCCLLGNHEQHLCCNYFSLSFNLALLLIYFKCRQATILRKL